MQVFGVAPDVDAAGHRRRLASPPAVATRAEVGRRAARFGDIVDVLVKKHTPSAATGSGAAALISPREGSPDPPAAPLRRMKRKPDVVPTSSPSWDTPATSLRGQTSYRRRFFDEAVRAQRYAELIDRPGRSPCSNSSSIAPEGLEEGLLEIADGEPLPLEVRRVLDALTPAGTDPTFGGEVAARLRALVEAQMDRCLRPTPEGQSPRQPAAFVGRARSQGARGYLPRAPSRSLASRARAAGGGYFVEDQRAALPEVEHWEVVDEDAFLSRPPLREEAQQVPGKSAASPNVQRQVPEALTPETRRRVQHAEVLTPDTKYLASEAISPDTKRCIVEAVSPDTRRRLHLDVEEDISPRRLQTLLTSRPMWKPKSRRPSEASVISEVPST